MRLRIGRALAIASVVLIPLDSTAATGPWRIGIVCPLTTPSRSFGIPHLQGVTLAIQQFRTTKPAIPLAIEIFDDRENAALADQQVHQLYAAGAVAVLGPCNSSVASPLIRSGLPIPIVSSLTSAAELTRDSPRFFFRANTPDTKRINDLLGLLFRDETRRPRRLFAFYEGNGDLYGGGMAGATREWLQSNELQFQAQYYREREYSRNLDADVAEQYITDLMDDGWGDGKDAVLLLGLSTDARTFVSALRRKRIKAAIYVPGPELAVFQALALEGVSVAGIGFVSPWDASDSRTAVLSFKQDFGQMFKDAAPPTYATALAYDGAVILLDALRRSVEAQPAGSVEDIREGIRRNLEASARPPGLVIDSQHRFEQQEFKDIEFVGRQFDSRANSVPWDQKIEEPQQSNRENTVPVKLPAAWVFAVVAVTGILGSATRELYRSPRRDLGAAFRVIRGVVTWAVDPIIAVTVFVVLFLTALIWAERFTNVVMGDTALISVLAAVAGFLAGFLGVRALYAVFARIGISEEFIHRAEAPRRGRARAVTDSRE